MSHNWLSLPDLSKQLGRDARELEKLVSRGRLPGHRRDGEWQFHESEIATWLEQELRTLSGDELARVESGHVSDAVDVNTPLTSLLKRELCEVPLEARTKRSVFEALVEVAGRTWQVWEPADVLAAIRHRDELCSTAFPGGVAVPHPRTPMHDALGESVVAFGKTGNGIAFGAPDGGMTDLFFLVLCRDAKTHLKVLARLSRMFQQPGFLAGLREAEDADAAYEVICQTESAV